MRIDRRGAARAAFTAIELLVVLVVILVLIGMAVPALVGAMRKGSVNDAANSIVRISSQARQFARTRSLGTPAEYYGLIIVQPTSGPAYVAVTYSDKAPTALTEVDVLTYPVHDPSGKPVAKLVLNRNVVIYSGPTNDADLTNPANQALGAGQAIGWYYQYRTGYPIYPTGAVSGWNTATNVNIGVDPGYPTTAPPTLPAGINPATSFPTALRHLTLRTADGKYRTAVAVYQIGLPNVQDF